MSKYFVLLCYLMLFLASCQQTKPQSVTFYDLMANPENYANQKLCTEGTAVSGFEASAIAAGTIERDGATFLAEPAVWLENVTPERQGDCYTSGLPPMEFCRVRACGHFETGGGFGHLGGYEYQLTGFVPTGVEDRTGEMIVPQTVIIQPTVTATAVPLPKRPFPWCGDSFLRRPSAGFPTEEQFPVRPRQAA